MKRITFIGAGKMAEAIVRGVTAAGSFSADEIMMSDTDPARLAEMRKKYGVATERDNVCAASGARCVLFAVKPQALGEVLADARRTRKADGTLYVSIAAGVKISSIKSALGDGAKVFRVMPNLPVFAGEGASAACGRGAKEDFETVRKIFGSVGIVEFVAEKQMDAFTAFSGSGPAFVAAFAESLISAGESLAIPPQLARKFAVQTFFGTSKMMSAGTDPEAVQRMVSSPGGTTAAGLAALDKSGFRQAVDGALKAAEKRAKQLASEAKTGREK